MRADNININVTADQSEPAAPSLCIQPIVLAAVFPISRTLRACATISSPNSLSNRLTQGECIPVSSTIRLRGIARKSLAGFWDWWTGPSHLI
jgi:hypothetical protein